MGPRKISMIVFMVGAVLGFTPIVLADQTYAERLGWPAGSKVVIFHCDDVGMSHASNMGAIQALEMGVVTSVSTLMPCSWVPEFAAYLKAHPNVDHGVETALTSEWKGYRWGPVAGAAAVPGLVDNEGCLWSSVEEVVKHASPDELEREIRAQIDRAQRMGIPLTHLDTHMGTVYATAEYLERYIKVGIEKHIPIMIMGGHMTYTRQEDARVDEFLKAGFPQKVWAGGLPVIDDLFNKVLETSAFEEKKKLVIKVLREMKPGIMQISTHCSLPTQEFSVFTPSSYETRLNDVRVVCDPEVKKVIQEQGIILTTWRELGQRRDKVGK